MCGHVAMSCVLIFYPFDLFEVYYFILNFCIISSLHGLITICFLHVENNRSGLLGDHVGLAM